MGASYSSGSSTYDAARKRLGGSWRIPTYEEWSWMIDNLTWTWKASGNTDYNGVAGWEVKGNHYSSKKIFLPAAGCYDGSTLDGAANYGQYWSTTLDDSTNSGYRVFFNSNNPKMYTLPRYYGL